jgi:branched-chain amino acid transport system substrate-binding protein
MVNLLNIFPCPAFGTQQPGRVTAIYASSGPYAEANAISVRGLWKVVKEINAGGGILGRWLELLEIDILRTPIGSKPATLKAIQNDDAIIGAAFGTHSIAIARGVVQGHGFPMITGISISPLGTRTGDYIFRIWYNVRQGTDPALFKLKDGRRPTSSL